jgi:hypothetical protein
LLAHARAEFALAQPVDGVPLRDHLEQVVASTQGRVVPPELNVPDLPSAMEYLWLWFCDLSGGRPHTGFGPGAIPYSEITAWASLTENDPSPWDVGLLKKLDAVYLEVASSKAGSPPSPPGGKRP